MTDACVKSQNVRTNNKQSISNEFCPSFLQLAQHSSLQQLLLYKNILIYIIYLIYVHKYIIYMCIYIYIYEYIIIIII